MERRRARLENWRLATWAHLHGDAYEYPGRPDGDTVLTGRIMSVRREGDKIIAASANTDWELGPSVELETLLKVFPLQEGQTNG